MHAVLLVAEQRCFLETRAQSDADCAVIDYAVCSRWASIVLPGNRATAFRGVHGIACIGPYRYHVCRCTLSRSIYRPNTARS